MQCYSGICYDYKCRGAPVNDICFDNQGCGSLNCTSGVCFGKGQFTWIGSSPFCDEK